MHQPTRRHLLRAASAVATCASLPSALADPTPFEWTAAGASSAGIAPDLAQRLQGALASGELTGLHAVFIARHGRLAMAQYFEGRDERWGQPIGSVAFTPDTLHDVRSMSKSVVGLLYGIALHEGHVPPVDTPLLQALGGFDDLARDERRRALQVRHALTMTLGLEWNEDLPYSDPRNSEIAMERSADRYRHILERPIVAPPGTQWRYSGGATALLGRLIARGSGMPLLQYAQRKLFGPLGITQSEWTAGTNGEAAAASGLRLSAPDLARIGQLMLQRGEWAGRQVVPRAWIDEALTPRATAWDGLQYGYQWYVMPRQGETPSFMAIGWGGQRLVVVPPLNLAYVIFMGNYQRADQLRQVFAIQRLIHASLR